MNKKNEILFPISIFNENNGAGKIEIVLKQQKTNLCATIS